MKWFFDKKPAPKSEAAELQPEPAAQPAPTSLDDDAQPRNRRYSIKRVMDRQVAELVGLCRGVLAGGEPGKPQAGALRVWLDAHPDVADEWLPREIGRAVDAALESGQWAELAGVLARAVGDPDSGSTAPGAAAALPLDDPPPEVVFEGKRFCMTGKFERGARKQVEALVRERGGVCGSKATSGTDFVVIGARASRDWVHSTMGTKIQDAVDLRDDGWPIKIVSERHWLLALDSNPPL